MAICILSSKKGLSEAQAAVHVVVSDDSMWKGAQVV